MLLLQVVPWRVSQIRYNDITSPWPSEMSESGWETIQGLKNVLEGHPVSIAKACQAVEKCLELNRCAITGVLMGFFGRGKAFHEPNSITS